MVANFARRIGLIGRMLDVVIERQVEDNWCWAACASGVSRFYDRGSDWTQCRVANAALEASHCCDDAEACDQPWWVHRALRATGNLAARHEHAESWRHVTEELRLGRPVIVRIQFPDTGHFVVVDGYRASGLLRIRDPNDGTVFEMRATALHDRYVGNGRWTHTYYTEA